VTPEPSSFRTAWWQRLPREAATYELTRFAILRLLAFVYLVAFWSLARQVEPLIGSRGLLPASSFVESMRGELGSGAFLRSPTLFWPGLLGTSDASLRVASVLGVVLSAAALLGVTNAVLQLGLWALYMSFVHVGQIFYGYGWEIQLLETGLVAVFLCPVRDVRPFPPAATPKVPIWLMRWIIFRVMLGAGLIKLRNDPCWRDLTCLDFHFETQPNPNPLAWWFHHAPPWVHAGGVLFNHFVELVAPWFVFGFRRWRHAAGALLLALQVTLILSGNLSFLNWLTMVPALACFDDTFFARALPARLRSRWLEWFSLLSPSKLQVRASQLFALVVLVFSVGPVANLASCDQSMNRSFDPLDIVNTYGAFGSVDRARYEVVLEGSSDPAPGRDARWQEYELPCTPGDPRRRPCVVTPYQHRLDWQMWFAGNGAARGESMEREPWLIHLVWQLLEGEPEPKHLLARDPFPDAPPKWIRAGIWRYRFTEKRSDEGWWTRQRVGEALPPLSVDNSRLREYVDAFGWPDAPDVGGASKAAE
jgi:hypothetical protein